MFIARLTLAFVKPRQSLHINAALVIVIQVFLLLLNNNRLSMLKHSLWSIYEQYWERKRKKFPMPFVASKAHDKYASSVTGRSELNRFRASRPSRQCHKRSIVGNTESRNRQPRPIDVCPLWMASSRIYGGNAHVTQTL